MIYIIFIISRFSLCTQCNYAHTFPVKQQAQRSQIMYFSAFLFSNDKQRNQMAINDTPFSLVLVVKLSMTDRVISGVY